MEEYIQKKEGYGHLLLSLIHFCNLIYINLFSVIVYYLFFLSLEQDPFSYDKKILTFLLVNLSYFITAFSIPIGTAENIIYIDKVIKRSLTFIVIFCVIATTLLTIFHIINYISMPLWVLIYSALISLYVLLHIAIRLALKSYRRRGYNHRTVIIVGSGESGKAIYNQLKNSDFGYRVKGYFDNNSTIKDDMPKYLGHLETIQEYILDHDIDEVYYTLTDNTENKITDLILFCEKNMVRFFLIPEFFNYVKRRFILRFIDSVPILSMRNEPLQHIPNRIAKRIFDVAFSSFVLVVIFPPILIVIGTIIKITSPGPLFFKQKRTGFQGKDFYCYKFRSMKVNEDSDKQQATKVDPRVTKIGSFIRKTSIDELPQFFNVLKGDMSIVGPRPHMLKHTEEYARIIDKYMLRHLVKPGITGWAQVCGFRGETKTIEDMEGRVRLDVWYIENWSFILDIKIIFKTVFNAIKGEDNAF